MRAPLWYAHLKVCLLWSIGELLARYCSCCHQWGIQFSAGIKAHHLNHLTITLRAHHLNHWTTPADHCHHHQTWLLLVMDILWMLQLSLVLGSPHIFYSCGEDGVVYQVDLRQEKPNKYAHCIFEYIRTYLGKVYNFCYVSSSHWAQCIQTAVV